MPVTLTYQDVERARDPDGSMPPVTVPGDGATVGEAVAAELGRRPAAKMTATETPTADADPPPPVEGIREDADAQGETPAAVAKQRHRRTTLAAIRRKVDDDA